MKNFFKRFKKPIIIVSVSIAIIALAVFLIFYFKGKGNGKAVDAVSVSEISTYYWGNQKSTYGTVTNEFSQEIFAPSVGQEVEILVTEGQSIKTGDVLLKYDSEKLQLEVEKTENMIEGYNLNISSAQSELYTLRNTTPISETPYIPPEPAKIPENDPGVSVYQKLDVLSKPYKGTGTAEDPYLFLCDDNYEIDPELFKLVFGIAFITPEGETVSLCSPCAVTFERREENSMYGRLLSSFTTDGTSYSGKADTIGEEPSAEPEPEPEPEEGYTAEQLSEMIKAKENELATLNSSLAEAQINLKRATLNLKNSSVTASTDGSVIKLIDIEEARTQNEPFLVVSGDSGYYLKGSISEDMLDLFPKGTILNATSWETGSAYTAEVTGIDENPISTTGGYTNQNSSVYGYTARIFETEGLYNGMYLDATFSGGEEEEENGNIYLWKAYIREENGKSYVLKASEEGILEKQYIESGKTVYDEYIEIISGVSMEDMLAFPYGDAVPGAKVNTETKGEVYY